jgi:ABC-type bacteriocin/lantibiotic exporter with double-glycine peptidase domain
VVLAFVYDLVRLIPMLRAGRMEKRAFTQWSQNFLAFQSRLMHSARISNRLAVVEPAWDAAALALCFAVLAYSGATGAISAGAAIVFVLALSRLIHAGRELAHVLMGAGKQLPMAKLARPLLEHPVEPLPPGPLGPTLAGGIEIQNVSFFYGARRALADVNLTIAPGEFIGLVGRSGSGKSTLLNVLLGLDKPHSGQVLLDGHDIGGLDRRQVARQIGVLMQGSRLFPGSIYENIRGVSAISLDEAWEFAAQAGVADELRALPMGLNTIVGESGSGLSVGQVHRILIARALAGKPAILVLDEALGSLDGRSQKRVLETLAGLNLTRILVTHRPSALVATDRVIVLDQGSVADVGPLDAIIARQSFFQATRQESR